MLLESINFHKTKLTTKWLLAICCMVLFGWRYKCTLHNCTSNWINKNGSGNVWRKKKKKTGRTTTKKRSNIIKNQSNYSVYYPKDYKCDTIRNGTSILWSTCHSSLFCISVNCNLYIYNSNTHTHSKTHTRSATTYQQLIASSAILEIAFWSRINKIKVHLGIHKACTCLVTRSNYWQSLVLWIGLSEMASGIENRTIWLNNSLAESSILLSLSSSLLFSLFLSLFENIDVFVLSREINDLPVPFDFNRMYLPFALIHRFQLYRWNDSREWINC